MLVSMILSEIQYDEYRFNLQVKAGEVNLIFLSWKFILSIKIKLFNLKNFINNLETTRRNLTNKKIEFLGGSMFYKIEIPKTIQSLDDIEEIIIYSIPIIQRSNDFGTDLSSTAGSILW